MDQEHSVLWQKVLGELWNERVSKDVVASRQDLPAGEVVNLIFGLTGAFEPVVRQTPELRLVC